MARIEKTSLFSAHWHRVKDVRPSLAPDVLVEKHCYRGKQTYVLKRAAGSSVHHLDAMSYCIVSQLDGERSVDEIWTRSLVDYDETAPTQDQWIELLSDLYKAELLIVDRRVPEERLFERREQQRNLDKKERYLNPLYIRIRLFNPENALRRCESLAHAVFNRRVAVVWAIFLFFAAISAFTYSDRLWWSLSEWDYLTSHNILLLICLFIPLKIFHEFAHALAVKRCGGEVHEVGLSLMVLIPMPYVDASDSNLFPNKRDRMLVSGAGILVESTVAAFGLILLLHTHGMLQSIGIALFVIGGISTVLFNGNPLLKFDGYYVFADWIEIPNLAARSRRKVLGKLKHLVSGKCAEEPVEEDRYETVWLYLYGISSTIFRTFIVLWIAWIVSDKWLLLGVLLAGFAVFSAIVLPLKRMTQALMTDPAYRNKRSLLLAGVLPLSLVGFAVATPLPHSSIAQGVIWMPDDSTILAPAQCEVTDVFKTPGSFVKKGEAILTCADPMATSQRDELIARIDELNTRRAGSVGRDPLQLDAIDAEITASEAVLNTLRERLDAARVVAPFDGIFDVNGTARLDGRMFVRGDLIGYVVPETRRTVRLAIEDHWIHQFDKKLVSVAVRVQGPDGLNRDFASEVVRRTPKSTFMVVNAALTTEGGGRLRADPRGDGRLLEEAVFDVEIAWPADDTYAPVGSSVDVRLEFERNSLFERLATGLRQAVSSRQAS